MAHPSTIDRFTILRSVGSGGMGTVYEAIDPTIDRRVAIKVLRHDVLTQNPEVLERLWIEARAANRIGHPGVVQVSEAGKLDDGTGYLVMEFLEGQTLRQRMQQNNSPLSLREALQFAVQIASTLNAGHQKGIVHRDLKPDNIMLVSDDAVTGGQRVKLLDFGIAKIAAPLAQTGAALTQNDMGLGTPGYMAPEQICNAANATDRTDVYALGAVLFEMLAGRRPYVAPSPAELLVVVITQDAPSLVEFVPEVSPTLAQLISSMLVRSPPISRPAMADVLRDLIFLSEATSGQRLPSTAEQQQGPRQLSSGSLRVVLPDAATSAATPSVVSGQAAPNAPPALRFSRRYSAIGTGILLALAVAVMAWRSPRRPPPLPPNSTIRPEPQSSPPKVTEPLPSRPPDPPATPTSPPGNDIALVTPTVGPASVDGHVTGSLPGSKPPGKPGHTAPRIMVTARCLPIMPDEISTAVSRAALGAGVKLAPEQSVVLLRQGEHGLVFANSHIDGISERARRDFESILRTELIGVSMHPTLRKIPIRCHAK